LDIFFVLIYNKQKQQTKTKNNKQQQTTTKERAQHTGYVITHTGPHHHTTSPYKAIKYHT